ncbi:MAG: 8-oxo-dGTP diphosphatase [Solirubrobacteraceae bacterium]|jgi:ADP-ribose pyrophosphatase YjhB (NUDIX family)|nr:8-oxo-dGTP diphosphatase [Solirubrobacteraceae bacterium]
MPPPPALLARGPWAPENVAARWREDEYEPHGEATAAADSAIAALRERGSPSHDGLGARLVDVSAADDRLDLELQPVRWSVRLGDDALSSLSALCVVRDAEGRWLAGRRAAWLATWAGRWALGAGGAVEVGENPADTLGRELEEEWSVRPARLSVEALVRIPSGLVLLVGLATLPAGAEVVADDEHDAHAWWPADIADWPPEADEPLRRMAALLAGSGGGGRGRE